MGLFDAIMGDRPSMSDKNLPDSDYKSTISADDPKFYSKFDKNVSVIIKNESSQDHYIDHGVYICFSGMSCAEVLKDLQHKKGASISAKMMRFGTILNEVLAKPDCRSVFLYGYTSTREAVSRTDLEGIKELIQGYELLRKRAVGEMNSAVLYDMLKKNFVYVIGELPRTDENGNRHFDKSVNIKKFIFTGSDARVSAMCYLDKRTAKLTYPNEVPSAIRLVELATSVGSVILEPESSNWVEFDLAHLGKKN